MEFILNENSFDLKFVEDKFVWKFDDKTETPYKEIIKKIESGTKFKKLSVETRKDDHIIIGLDNGTWDVEMKLSVHEDDEHYMGSKYFFYISLYAEEIDGEYDTPYDMDGPLCDTIQGVYVTANSEKEAFEMFGEAFDIVLTKLENYEEENEEE